MWQKGDNKKMRVSRFTAWILACVVVLAAVPDSWLRDAQAQVGLRGDAVTGSHDAKPKNELCLGCHGYEGFGVPTGEAGEQAMRKLYVSPDLFKQSVHSRRACVDCHWDIVQIPHRRNEKRDAVNCVNCHLDTMATQNEKGVKEYQRVDVVVENIKSYMGSIHARPSKQDLSKPNAYCSDCHDPHTFAPLGTKARWDFRLAIPEVCGNCHADIARAYSNSVHGREVKQEGNPHAAVCIDCHTTHEIESPEVDSTKLAITANCGNCHGQQLKTYTGTYHGQVTTLGYAYTAKCYDCHGHHQIQRVNDESSRMHVNNRLETCRKCHADASKGFISFHPHGNTADFGRYPFMWVASKFMIGLLAGVFAFFWLHSALWFYREYQDRKEGKNAPHIQVDTLPQANEQYVKRWSLTWRICHLLLALAVMTLVLTGTSALFAESAWAQTVMRLIGGPRIAGLLHRIAALTFITLFFGHLLFFAYHVIKNHKTWKWFGPNSLVPNFDDLKQATAMFKWFFGLAPRPVFDRWAYWEKFDYWAPFWGMAIIGISGAMLWFPGATASVLPGWVFNVATIVHGEEAFLAAVFLFSVHFFNVHFRPDKLPQDIVMFTGVMPLEEYKHEHTLEYQRLLDRGELDKYLVDAPSRPMTLGSKILGATLILIGLTLLVLVLLGFWENVVMA
jgi:cytochrome b subunit of formate dehydrogenase